MSSKFFTNEEKNTLLNKIRGIFDHRDICFFDAVVGYFRASGYFRIRPFVEKAESIRILVGINMDGLIYEANRQGVLFVESTEKTIGCFFDELKKNIRESEYDKIVEDGIFQLMQDLIAKKVIIRVHPKQNLHAKIYIFREKEKHDHGYGAVITGSSNLTDNGLERNFEFNVELREDTDIDFATETFNKLWNESVEIGQDFVEKLKQEVYPDLTPYQVYYKFLIGYFGPTIDFDPNSVQDLPSGFKRLSYQIDAVSDGYSKMMKHNGFFLSDVVGLGKTVVATLIAKKFFYANEFPSYLSKTLVVCPPALKENWDDTLSKFGLHGYKIITSGSLHKVTKPHDYDLIIVDEAHKFRNDTAGMYTELQKICKTPTRKNLPKKVILVSATPLNNRPEDIANQVYLFQDAKDSTLDTINLQNFFRKKIDAYKNIKQERDIGKVADSVKELYEDIRTRVIEPLTVRRTRADIIENDEYNRDLKVQGIEFPLVNTPQRILYQLDSQLECLYDKTIECLRTELNYYRYQAIRFLKPHKKSKYTKADMISSQLAEIMKSLLVKRIDSSFYAFKQSLKRFYKATDAMVSMFEKGCVYIAPNKNVTDYIYDGREDELVEMINMSGADSTMDICTAEDFENGFLEGLERDRQLLGDLVSEWEKIGEDPKLEVFIRRLKEELFDPSINKKGKLVVFSESQETTSYLEKELRKAGFNKILVVSSKNIKETLPLVKSNFDANIAIHEQKDDYDICISTEVLAEGVNMHRANIIVNYDTPWNSTRLMQRIGRVNRIGSVGPIHIYNFFPTAKVNDDIELEKKAIMKLQAFHSALGEDSQIYSPDEITESFGLFDKAVHEEKDEKLQILLELRKFKKENPDFFWFIERLPLRVRTGRKNPLLRESTIIFIRNDRRDAFLLVRENGKIEELTFLQAEKEYRARQTEKSRPLHSKHYDQVVEAVQFFSMKIEEERQRERSIEIQGPNEKKALTFLNAVLNQQSITTEEKELLLDAKTAIRRGQFQQLQRDINKLDKSQKINPLPLAILSKEIIKLLRTYPLRGVQVEGKKTLDTYPRVKDFQPQMITIESFND